MKAVKDFHELEKFLTPSNEAQKEAERRFPTADVLILEGPAGVGKTHQAVKLAISALDKREVRQIVLTRPTVESGGTLGLLPGDVRRKMGPWLEPIKDVLRSMTHVKPDEIMKTLEVCPLQLMRGRTFNNSVAILDEAQNCTELQLDLFLSRIGRKGKLIICGSNDQSDLGSNKALEPFIRSLAHLPFVAVIRFTEKMAAARHPNLPALLEARRKAKAKRSAKS